MRTADENLIGITFWSHNEASNVDIDIQGIFKICHYCI